LPVGQWLCTELAFVILSKLVQIAMLLTSGQISMGISSCVGKSAAENDLHLVTGLSLLVHVIAFPLRLCTTTTDCTQPTSSNQAASTTRGDSKPGPSETFWHPTRTFLLRQIPVQKYTQGRLGEGWVRADCKKSCRSLQRCHAFRCARATGKYGPEDNLLSEVLERAEIGTWTSRQNVRDKYAASSHCCIKV